MAVLKGVAVSDTGGGGTPLSKGTAIIDFGAFPGSNEADVAVTGQASITSANIAEAFMAYATSADHTENDHAYTAVITSLTCSTPTNGVGFTIYARSTEKLQGEYTINWIWA